MNIEPGRIVLLLVHLMALMLIIFGIILEVKQGNAKIEAKTYQYKQQKKVVE